MKEVFLLPFAWCLLASSLLSQGVWTQKADFGGYNRHYAVGFSIGTKGYIGTGYFSSQFSTDSLFDNFWEWDQTSNIWTQKADFGGTARTNAVGFSIGSKGYIGIGGDINGSKQDLWEWDQASNTWIQKSIFPGTPRSQTVSFSVGTKGYIGTGLIMPNCTRDFWEWDQTTNIWTQKANFGGTDRRWAVGFCIGNNGYIGTGIDSTGTMKKDFWEYDPSANIWTQKSDYGGGTKYAAIGFSLGTIGYIVTGADTGTGKGFWEWDQTTNLWSQRPDFGGYPRYHSVGFNIGNKGYVGTGKIPSFGSGGTKDFWEFDPNGNSTNEVELEKSISAFPNPTIDGKFTVSSLQFPVNSLDIYNLSGELVYHSTQNHKLETVNLNESGGIYLLQIKTDQGNVTKKIVLSH